MTCTCGTNDWQKCESCREEILRRKLPRIGSKDVVGDISKKKRLAKLAKIRNRCFGTISCDCRRCVKSY